MSHVRGVQAVFPRRPVLFCCFVLFFPCRSLPLDSFSTSSWAFAILSVDSASRCFAGSSPERELERGSVGALPAATGMRSGGGALRMRKHGGHGVLRTRGSSLPSSGLRAVSRGLAGQWRARLRLSRAKGTAEQTASSVLGSRAQRAGSGIRPAQEKAGEPAGCEGQGPPAGRQHESAAAGAEAAQPAPGPGGGDGAPPVPGPHQRGGPAGESPRPRGRAFASPRESRTGRRARPGPAGPLVCRRCTRAAQGAPRYRSLASTLLVLVEPLLARESALLLGSCPPSLRPPQREPHGSPFSQVSKKWGPLPAKGPSPRVALG